MEEEKGLFIVLLIKGMLLDSLFKEKIYLSCI